MWLIFIYLSAIIIYILSEFILLKHYSGNTGRIPVKGLMAMIVSFYSTLFMPVIEYLFVKPEIMLLRIIAAIALLTLGIVLRISAFSILRGNFSTSITPANEGKLITNGIYGYIRHPLYLGLIFVSLSGMIYFNVRVSWVFFVAELVFILQRINKEEIFLHDRFPEYAVYVRKANKLIPFIY